MTVLKNDKLYACLCEECEYSLIPVSRYFAIFHRCNHPVVATLNFSTQDFKEFKDDDFTKADRLVEEILKLKLNPVIKIYQTVFGFPFQYEPIWIEGCDGFEKR